jgi:hypothetical protein
MENIEDLKIIDEFYQLVDDMFSESCNDLFNTLSDGDVSFIRDIKGIKIRIERAISHFSSVEEYEKCAFLRKLIEKYKL